MTGDGTYEGFGKLQAMTGDGTYEELSKLKGTRNGFMPNKNCYDEYSFSK